VDELPEADALALIESYQTGGKFRDAAERGAAEEIVRLLGRFTLAVEAAAVFLGQFGRVQRAASHLLHGGRLTAGGPSFAAMLRRPTSRRR
jgi:hypothetical protein